MDTVDEGFIILDFTIDTPEKNIYIFPEPATITTNTGEQAEGNYVLPRFAGDDIKKGTKISGQAAYPLKKLNSVSDITLPVFIYYFLVVMKQISD